MTSALLALSASTVFTLQTDLCLSVRVRKLVSAYQRESKKEEARQAAKVSPPPHTMFSPMSLSDNAIYTLFESKNNVDYG